MLPMSEVCAPPQETAHEPTHMSQLLRLGCSTGFLVGLLTLGEDAFPLPASIYYETRTMFSGTRRHFSACSPATLDACSPAERQLIDAVREVPEPLRQLRDVLQAHDFQSQIQCLTIGRVWQVILRPATVKPATVKPATVKPATVKPALNGATKRVFLLRCGQTTWRRSTRC